MHEAHSQFIWHGGNHALASCAAAIIDRPSGLAPHAARWRSKGMQRHAREFFWVCTLWALQQRALLVPSRVVHFLLEKI